jgi:hypothetical protein
MFLSYREEGACLGALFFYSVVDPCPLRPVRAPLPWEPESNPKASSFLVTQRSRKKFSAGFSRLKRIGYIYLYLKTKDMTKGFKELLRLAKQEKVTTYDQLFNLSQQCVNEITGADFDSVRRKLQIKMF